MIPDYKRTSKVLFFLLVELLSVVLSAELCVVRKLSMVDGVSRQPIAVARVFTLRVKSFVLTGSEREINCPQLVRILLQTKGTPRIYT